MNGIDCATKLNATTAAGLKAEGISVVGRYLGLSSWKGLTPEEVKAIQDAGLAIFPIWETAPTKASYFSYSKGQSDVKAALTELSALGVPQGVALYFTVDYDAQSADMIEICDYFRGVRDGLAGKYLVGAYGSFDVLTALEPTGKVDRYYQTYAWSRKKVYRANDIYQYQNGVTIGGVEVDKDEVNNATGLWFKDAVPALAPEQKPDLQNSSYPNNAKVVGDDLYIRDVNGNRISGRYVANRDPITVLDVSYSKQLAKVEYPTPAGVKIGYVRNVPNLIKYFNQGQWHNGSTPEPVLDENGAKIGSVNPREATTPLYRRNGKLHVVYNTDKGANTKSGYVAYNGGFSKF
jgi:hypothetical protein